MIKQILFIILAITCITATRTNPNNKRIKGKTTQAPEARSLVKSDFDETKIAELKQVLTQKNKDLFNAFKFEIVPSNDNFELFMDLAFATKANNPKKSHIKRFYNFAIKSEFLGIECKFNFSVFTNLLEENKDFDENVNTCNQLLSHVSVVDNNAVIERLPTIQPANTFKIQLDEPVTIVQYAYESVDLEDFGDKTNSKITKEVRDEITKVHPTLLKNLQIEISNGRRYVHHSSEIKANPDNQTGTDVRTKDNFTLKNSDLNIIYGIEVQYYGEGPLSENEAFKKSILDFVTTNEEELGEKIGDVMTNPKLVAYNEPVIYMEKEVISLPTVQAYTYTPVESYNQEKDNNVEHSPLRREQHLGDLLGAPKKCTAEDKGLLMNHYENLLNSGRFGGMLYTENVLSCTIQRELGDLFHVILRFDGKDCYLNLYALQGNLQVQDHLAKRNGSFIIQGSDDGLDMRNCA